MAAAQAKADRSCGCQRPDAGSARDSIREPGACQPLCPRASGRVQAPAHHDLPVVLLSSVSGGGQARIIATLATILAKHKIGLDAVLQLPADNWRGLPFVITTEPTSEQAIRTALNEMSSEDFLTEPPLRCPWSAAFNESTQSGTGKPASVPMLRSLMTQQNRRGG